MSSLLGPGSPQDDEQRRALEAAIAEQERRLQRDVVQLRTRLHHQVQAVVPWHRHPYLTLGGGFLLGYLLGRR